MNILPVDLLSPNIVLVALRNLLRTVVTYCKVCFNLRTRVIQTHPNAITQTSALADPLPSGRRPEETSKSD